MTIREKYIYHGEDIVWRAVGGNYALTMTGIADAAAREGDVGDLATTSRVGGRIRSRPKFMVELRVNMDVAPVAGTVVELWWCPSSDGATFTAGITGADADWAGSALGTVANSKLQLIHIGSIILTPDADGTVQIGTWVFQPQGRWGVPVLVNLGGQALEGDDDSHLLTFSPIVEEVA